MKFIHIFDATYCSTTIQPAFLDSLQEMIDLKEGSIMMHTSH